MAEIFCVVAWIGSGQQPSSSIARWVLSNAGPDLKPSTSLAGGGEGELGGKDLLPRDDGFVSHFQ